MNKLYVAVIQHYRVISLLCLLFSGSIVSADQHLKEQNNWGYSETYISFLTGDGYQEFPEQGFALKEQAKQILTFEHASSFSFGDQFFFFDVNKLDYDTYLYGEWHPRVSFSKTFGKDFSFWFFRDIYFAHEQDYGEDYTKYFYGLSVDLDIASASYFTLSVLFGGDPEVEGDSTEIILAWSFPISLGSWKFRFLGYLDYLTGENETMVTQIQAQPQLLLDIGDLIGNPGSVFAGIEYQYWDNKYGIEGVSESVPQLIFTWLL